MKPANGGEQLGGEVEEDSSAAAEAEISDARRVFPEGASAGEANLAGALSTLRSLGAQGRIFPVLCRDFTALGDSFFETAELCDLLLHRFEEIRQEQLVLPLLLLLQHCFLSSTPQRRSDKD